jgi:hypothetical protein
MCKDEERMWTAWAGLTVVMAVIAALIIAVG